jgi:hypothetical protein
MNQNYLVSLALSVILSKRHSLLEFKKEKSWTFETTCTPPGVVTVSFEIVSLSPRHRASSRYIWSRQPPYGG